MKHRKERPVIKHPKRKQPVSDSSVRRAILIALGIMGILAFGVLTGRLVKLMIIDHDYYEAKAIRNQTRSTSVTASRGTIYDRNMNVLAASESVENIFLDPLELDENSEKVSLDTVANGLAELLDLDADWIKQQAADTKMRYKVIKRRQSKDVCDKVREFISENRIIGVHLEPDSKRYYPYSSLAAQVLGFTNTENVGSEGLESYYNTVLSGRAGAVITTKGNHETQMLYSYEKYYQASDGERLVLTIDTTVQYYLEKHMKDAVDRYDVLNGAFGIVMDAKTGEILAMSTMGSYDPNNYLKIVDLRTQNQLAEMYDKVKLLPEGSEERQSALDAYNSAVVAAQFKQWRNRCVSDGYEPGSTFKVLTLAAALDTGAIKELDEFYCGGKEKIEGREQILNCWKHSGHGKLTAAGALQNSCNIAFAHIGLKLGGGALYDYARAFGLMEQTGIDLPGESEGIFHSRERLANTAKYGTSYLTSTSFGQSIKPTPLQMVRAVAAVVNGGYLLEPYLVSQVLDKDGNVVKQYSRNVLRQVISEETSQIMCRLMEATVADGTSRNGKVAGYRIGGKTGTAEKLDQLNPDGTYTNDKITSFIGVAPMEDPRYVILIALDTPNSVGGTYISGGVMGAPTVAAVFEDVLPYLGVEPEYTDAEISRVNVTMPDVTGLTESAAAKLLADKSLEYRIIGNGDKIVSQIPAAGRQLPGKSTVLLYTDDSMPTDQVTVPNLMGMTVAEATKALNDAGLYLQAKGTDSTAWHVLVTAQDIAAGTQVARGTTVTVIFADTTAMD